MKVISLVSTGIDSPVASHLMKKQGFEQVYLHLKTKDSDDETIKKLVEKIDSGAKLIIKDYVPTLNKIRGKGNTRFTCILCKRGMYREAEKIAKEEGAKAIVTGENLAQVASQTLDNMVVIDASVTLPVLRPLLCLDKNETIAIARKIDTFGLSTKDTSKCAYVPKSPATRSKLFVIEKEEEKVFWCLDD